MAIKEELIKTLIIQYDESIRLQSDLLDCGFAEALLSVIPINMKNREALAALLDKRTNDCEQLKKCLETARKGVSKLFAKHEGNIQLKKFLDFAFSLSTFREADEDVNVEANSKAKNLFQYYDVSLKNNSAVELNKNNNEHESEEVELQFYEMTINLMSKLSIGNELLNPNENGEISSKCIQNPTSTPAKSSNSKTTSTKYHFKCNTCGKGFLKKKNIILHVRQHMEIQSFYCTKCGLCCNICGMKYSRRHSLKNHIRQIHLKQKPFECTECGKCFGRKYNMKKHILVHNREPQKVDHFSSKFQSEISKLRCKICDRKYSSKNTLRHHISQVHLKEKPFECAECGKHFPRKQHLRLHISMHNRKPKMIDNFSEECQREISRLCCDICGKTYSYKNGLNEHIRQKHLNEKPYECTECGKRFLQNNHLKNHALTHGSLKPFKCSICNMDFKRPSDKTRHERIVHRGISYFHCAHCDKQFNHKNLLISHIHTKHFPAFKKQFVCKICDKSFVFKKRLEEHKLSHKSRNSFKCSVCDKYFKYETSKARHEKKVHGKDVRFRCKHCDKGYLREMFLIRHLREKHSESHDSN